MTIGEFRNLFESDPVIHLECYSENFDSVESFIITNILYGCAAFNTMQILPSSVYTWNDEVYIKTDMPYSVFMAWKECAENNR